MMENTHSTTSGETEKHELNLWELFLIVFRAIGRFFRWIYFGLLSSLRLLLQQWYISLPIFGLCIGLLWYYSRVENRQYKVGVMVHLSGVNVMDVDRVYTALENATIPMINANQALATLLALPAEDVKDISRFESFRVVDYKHDSVPDMIDFHRNHDLADTVNVVMPDYLYLQFRTKAPQNAQHVGDAVIAYLNQDASLQTMYEAHKAILERKATFCHTQIEKLDSMTSVYYFQQGNAQIQYDRWSTALVVGEREIHLPTNDILAFIQQTACAEKQLQMATAAVAPMGNFVVSPRAVNNRLKCLVIALVAGYILSCLIALGWKRRKQFLAWVRGKA